MHFVNILEILLIVLIIYNGAEAFSCNKNYDDPHRCDKIQPQTVKCVFIPSRLFTCNKNNNNKAICYHKLCFNVDPICTLSCCDGWKEDQHGRCSKHIGSDSDQHYKKTDVSTKVISGVIVAILFLVLAVLSVAMCRVCKSRQNIRNRRCQSRAQQRHQSSVFTVYENEPPPYELAVRSKLPDYSQCNDLPPEYHEIDICPNEERSYSGETSASAPPGQRAVLTTATENMLTSSAVGHSPDSDLV